ncbi:RRP15-like protein [Choanephora cucurbitarum]|uniref:RRP15-like protein n=1 Tax=Choanephora cucurbitarum TaxID=101091 RepID=A0A1C7NGU0_9FUNG|nr:RRP15-like protein [Choanephora cucurbitarum]
MAAKKQIKKQSSTKEEIEVVPKKTVTFSQKVQKKRKTPAEPTLEQNNSTEEEDEDEDEKDSEDESMDENEDADVEESEDDDDDDMDLDNEEVKQPKKYSSEAFSDAMTKILASSLSGSDKKQPILARSKGVERKIEDEKLDHKARKILSAQKKALKEKGRVIPDYTTFDYEKGLRKVATRGVVKLFNAIRTQQKVTEVAVEKAASTRKTRVAIEKAKDVSTMSKSSFLDLLKTGQK